MISILIVEDDKYKLEKIKSVLVEDLMIESSLIDEAKDIKQAKRYLVKKTYDLAILDLVLPLELGDSPSADKGMQFLRDIEMNPSLTKPIHLIGMTSFEDMQKQYKDEFEQYLWHLINYKAIETDWVEKLKNYVYHLLTIKQNFASTVQTPPYKCDVFVLTALSQPEFEKILQWPVTWQKFSMPNDPSVYYKCTIGISEEPLVVIAACVEQMGMTATAVMTTKIIYTFKPGTIIMGGICAGLKERNLNYGDILIAEQCWDYGSGKMKNSESDGDEVGETIFEPDPRPIPLAPSLKSKINSLLFRSDIISKIQNDCKYQKPDVLLKAMMGPLASGSYVISTQAKLDEIKKTQRKLLGVEMEGYGLYYACDHNQDYSVKGVMIKSVSDFGDSSKNDQFQDYSSFTSAQFIYYFILEELTSIG
jgi:nucleoside phosphorylase